MKTDKSDGGAAAAGAAAVENDDDDDDFDADEHLDGQFDGDEGAEGGENNVDYQEMRLRKQKDLAAMVT